MAEPFPDIALLDEKIAEAAKAIEESETTSEKRKAKERREDLMRLKRVEQIYVRPYLCEMASQSIKLTSECGSTRVVWLGPSVVEIAIGHCLGQHKYAASLIGVQCIPTWCLFS